MLVALIGAAPAGLGIEAIAGQLGHRYPRRTLQRRLALLVEQQRIAMLGEKRATRYRRLAAAVEICHGRYVKDHR